MKMNCICSQKHHEAPVKVIEMSPNAINKIPDILSGYKRIFMVCDKYTYNVAGKKS